MGKVNDEGEIYWLLKNWNDYDDCVEPNSNKLSWKLTNPDKIQLDKIFLKVTKVFVKQGIFRRKVKREWKIEIDGEQADCTFDNNYETEIKGKGFKKDHLRVIRIEI